MVEDEEEEEEEEEFLLLFLSPLWVERSQSADPSWKREERDPCLVLMEGARGSSFAVL